MPRSKQKSTPAPLAPPQRLHLDRRAGQIAAAVEGDDDGNLTTQQTAELLGTSVPWLEIGRLRGYGPPFVRLSPGLVRYNRGALRAWLRERQYLRTSEYRRKDRRAQAGAGAP